jgi:predicted metal-dependent hydrolase
LIQEITVGEMVISLHRKAIKNLNISILPPEGSIRVSAPVNMPETMIRSAVIKRIPWIKDKQAQFQQQTRVSAREICSGESHYLWGKRYRLEVIERQGKHELMVEKDKLVLYVSPNTTRDKRNKVMQDHYRQQLNGKISALFAHWLPIIRVIIKDWRVQQMKTRWGSCAIHSKRILLNLELAKKPPVCLEYVLVHELIHLLEPSHNARFHALMDHFLPDWKERKALLASYPIAD